MPAPGLGSEDRQVLAQWLGSVAGNRIDTAVDLSRREWNVPGALAIIGVFEPARDGASWLAVADEMGWTLLDCTSGLVSGQGETLADVLALIPA